MVTRFIGVRRQYAWMLRDDFQDSKFGSPAVPVGANRQVPNQAMLFGYFVIPALGPYAQPDPSLGCSPSGQ